MKTSNVILTILSVSLLALPAHATDAVGSAAAAAANATDEVMISGQLHKESDNQGKEDDC